MQLFIGAGFNNMTYDRFNCFQVVEILSQVLADLVQGEFMQLQTKQDEEDRFNLKTMTKTATNTITKTMT